MLVPPSEGKAHGGSGEEWAPDQGVFGSLTPWRRQVVDALAAVSGGDERLLGVRSEHLARARSANAALLGAPTLPAWQRYTGVVWDHLEPATLRTAERRRIVVVSGLHGVVRGDDPVPDYRLKMGANLAPLGKLSTWWRDPVSEAIDALTRRRTRRPRVLVDLLPQEHAAAWRPAPAVPGIRVDFVDPSGKPGGHGAKAAKGRLARALLDHGLDAVDGWTDDRFELAVTPLAR